MVDLVLGDVEPPPMRIHYRSGAEGLLQPRIVASGKALECAAAYLVELMEVMLEWLVAQKTAPRIAEGDGRLPRCSLELRGCPVLERETLIPTLDRGDVCQQRADRVA